MFVNLFICSECFACAGVLLALIVHESPLFSLSVFVSFNLVNLLSRSSLLLESMVRFEQEFISYVEIVKVM